MRRQKISHGETHKAVHSKSFTWHLAEPQRFKMWLACWKEGAEIKSGKKMKVVKSGVARSKERVRV